MKYAGKVAAQMANQVDNIFVGVWPLGAFKSGPGGFDICCSRASLETHEVVVEQSKIDKIVAEVRA